MQNTERRTVECLRCGFRWRPFYGGTPQKCASCSSTLWNTPRRIKWSKPAKRHPMAGPIVALLILCGTVLPLGSLVKTVQTDAGPMSIYEDVLGCTVTLNGVQVDRVSLEICRA